MTCLSHNILYVCIYLTTMRMQSACHFIGTYLAIANNVPGLAVHRLQIGRTECFDITSLIERDDSIGRVDKKGGGQKGRQEEGKEG